MPAFRPLILALCISLPLTAIAKEQSAPPPDPLDTPELLRAGFLEGHQDMKYRMLGQRAYREKRYDDAFRLFSRAAFYADKPAQGMIAEMYWNGDGMPRDRALAYAWMDLAAERGYQGFAGLRERYWAALDANERERALAEGGAIYARYGDAAARPRADFQLRLARRSITGSRTGMVGALTISITTPSGEETIDASKFYDERYWDPDKYWAWQDQVWMKPRIGKVEVGEAEVVRDGTPASRIPATTPEADAPPPEVPPEP
ncbi:sel1 repeat family protein [Aerolutibacter daejeonensis]|uniref:sel1 repeat family protein n=1 Tax=Aerolutibacter daejeonensis TaxID=346181 RepID=UPI00068A2C67|nr:sel1 repeat family protein [Lysobacter daejeonensis]